MDINVEYEENQIPLLSSFEQEETVTTYLVIDNELCEVESNNEYNMDVDHLDEIVLSDNVCSEKSDEYQSLEYLDEEQDVDIPTKLKKKRKNLEEWKCNKRKALRQSGKQYVSVRNKIIPAKTMKGVENCLVKCKGSCKLISEDERCKIFQDFYNTDAEGKTNFILMSTVRNEPARKTQNSNKKNILTSISL